jgi:hypothetical protein
MATVHNECADCGDADGRDWWHWSLWVDEFDLYGGHVAGINGYGSAYGALDRQHVGVADALQVLSQTEAAAAVLDVVHHHRHRSVTVEPQREYVIKLAAKHEPVAVIVVVTDQLTLGDPTGTGSGDNQRDLHAAQQRAGVRPPVQPAAASYRSTSIILPSPVRQGWQPARRGLRRLDSPARNLITFTHMPLVDRYPTRRRSDAWRAR